MRLTIEIDLSAGAVAEDATAEAGRILRYWAGSLKHIDLTGEQAHDLTDSAYAPVGVLRVVG